MKLFRSQKRKELAFLDKSFLDILTVVVILIQSVLRKGKLIVAKISCFRCLLISNELVTKVICIHYKNLLYNIDSITFSTN